MTENLRNFEISELTATEAWCVDTVMQMRLATDEIRDAVQRSFGTGVNHQAIIDEVMRRRGS